MRTIVHLSDLHFGKEEPGLVAAVCGEIHAIRPDLIVVSGDLTQRARIPQFDSARKFLESLPFQRLVVPGNHDVAPWHRVVDRLTDGFRDYHHYITEDEDPFYEDAEISVVGVNSARIFSRKGGRINMEQVERCCERLRGSQRDAVKVLVSHHPFDLPPDYSASDLIGRAHTAMTKLAECKVDVFLSGHLHVSHACETARRYRIRGHSAISVQAGTAVSTRLREQLNSWNLLRIQRSIIVIDRFQWDESLKRFSIGSTDEFHYLDSGWSRAQGSFSKRFS